MKNGYELVWTDFALTELEATIRFLEENWTKRELQSLAKNLDHTLRLISQNPNLFPVSDLKNNIRRAIVQINNTLYYRINEGKIEILSFFSNRQSPQKRNIP